MQRYTAISILSAALVFAASAGNVLAQTTVPSTAAVAASAPASVNTPVKLGPKDTQALSLVNKWKDHADKPRIDADGTIYYLFGRSMPRAVCAELSVCNIRLQPGERMVDIHAGDTARWLIKPGKVAPTIRGDQASVIIKPTEPNLSTNLLIITDRRTYSIDLVSTTGQYMPKVAFDYPDEVDAEWDQYFRQQQSRKAAEVIPQTGLNVASLDFGFKLSGDSPTWKPERIYADGQKTYIQFPRGVQKLPVLLALGNGDKKQIVNHRPQEDSQTGVMTFIVDRVLDHGVLITGVGDDETRVEFVRKGAK